LCHQVAAGWAVVEGCREALLADGDPYAGRDAIDRGLPILVGMRQVRLINSIGIAFLGQLVAAGAESDWRLSVTGAADVVADSLTLAGLTRYLDLS
jgi:hypothetical protein